MADSTATSCTSSTDLLRPALRQQIGGEQRRFVAALLPDARDQRVRGGIGELVEPALERGRRGLGMEAGRRDVLVAEEALQVRNVHADRQQTRCHRVAQQMRIDTLADPGGNGDGATIWPTRWRVSTCGVGPEPA